MFFVLLALFATLGWLTAGLLALTSASDVEGGSSTSEATQTASLAVISSIIVIAIFWSIGFHHYDIHPKILAWTAYLFDWHHVATAIAFAVGFFLRRNQQLLADFGQDVRDS